LYALLSANIRVGLGQSVVYSHYKNWRMSSVCSSYPDTWAWDGNFSERMHRRKSGFKFAFGRNKKR